MNKWIIHKDGLKIDITPAPIKRIIPIEEVRATDSYSDLADLAEIFNHEVVETNEGIWRWKQNHLMSLIQNYAPVYTPSGPESEARGEIPYSRDCKCFRASLDLNQLAVDLHRGLYTVEEKMKFHMQIGYSLSGFGEIFGQHEAYELNLPGALPPAADEDDYVETVIEYMRRIHKGKVLKL